MPEKALKTIEKSLFYSKKTVALAGRSNWRAHGTNDTNAANRTDENTTKEIAKFANQLQNEFTYGIPLKFLCDVGLANQIFKFSKNCILTLETDMQKLFETNANQAADVCRC